MHRGNNNRLRLGLALAPLALVVSAGVAHAAATLPALKPGLWTTSMVIHMTMAGRPPDTDSTPRVTYNCQDNTTMAAMMKKLSGMMQGCVFDMEGSGGSYTVTTNCKNPQGLTGTVTGFGTLTLMGNSAYHMADKTTSDLVNMKMTADMTSDAHWVGACPAGVMPGDFGTMQNGTFTKEGNTLTPRPGAP